MARWYGDVTLPVGRTPLARVCGSGAATRAQAPARLEPLGRGDRVGDRIGDRIGAATIEAAEAGGRIGSATVSAPPTGGSPGIAPAAGLFEV